MENMVKVLKEKSGVLVLDVAERGCLIPAGTFVKIQAVAINKDLSVRVIGPETTARLNYYDTDIDELVH